jgi:hypothetical protein
MKEIRFGLLLPALLLLAPDPNFAQGKPAAPLQTSEFNYQGRLTDGGTPANGTYACSSSCSKLRPWEQARRKSEQTPTRTCPL